MVRRRLLVVAVALVLVVGLSGLAVLGTTTWKRLHRTPLEEALASVPAGSLRVGFTDWAAVRRTLHADLGARPSDSRITTFMDKAYDADFSAASSIDASAPALQDHYGFSPANVQWEAYAQGRDGATMVLKVADGTDFGVLAQHLRTTGYTRPEAAEGVWKGGVDLVAGLDPTITPELQYVVLLEDQGLVVTSDSQAYAGTAAAAATGDRETLAASGRADGLAGRLGTPANAMLWTGDFACEDLAMSRADEDAQAQGKDLVAEAGGVTPLDGLAMSMRTSRTLRVVEAFEDSEQARRNLRPRAQLAVGEAVGRGGSFSDDLRLTSSRSDGPTVLLDLRPKARTGYVLSSLYDGPLLFATC